MLACVCGYLYKAYIAMRMAIAIVMASAPRSVRGLNSMLRTLAWLSRPQQEGWTRKELRAKQSNELLLATPIPWDPLSFL